MFFHLYQLQNYELVAWFTYVTVFIVRFMPIAE